MSKDIEKKSGMKEVFNTIAVAFVIAMIIRTFLLEAYTIPSGSMRNTLLEGDFLLVNKTAYNFSDPKHGDIVIFRYPIEPEKAFVKRVIGTPGDEIEIKDKVVYRNGERLDESYAIIDPDIPVFQDIKDNVAKFVVPNGMYYMLGDNRDNSLDSRFWGFVNRKDIVGKPWIIYFSAGDGSIRFKRILNRIK